MVISLMTEKKQKIINDKKPLCINRILLELVFELFFEQNTTKHGETN